MGNEKTYCIIVCEKKGIIRQPFQGVQPKGYDSLQKLSKELMVAVGLSGFAVPSIRNSY
jgi:hypothetical protein